MHFAITDWFQNVQYLTRWLHVLAGITWIGHLYFFNFVNAQVQPKLDGPTKKVVNPQLMPRALFWFRWGAMITFLSGLLLFTLLYMYAPGVGFGPNKGTFSLPEGGLSDRAIWILIGMGLGFVMWFNVWFIIWPAQQKIIRAVRDGNPPDAALVKKATFASKFNTHASAPMLFGMLGASHYSSFNVFTFVIVLLVAEFAIWAAYKGSASAGSSI